MLLIRRFNGSPGRLDRPAADIADIRLLDRRAAQTQECRLQKNSQFHAEGIRVPAVAGQRAAVPPMYKSPHSLGLIRRPSLTLTIVSPAALSMTGGELGSTTVTFPPRRRPTDELCHRRHLP